MNDEYAADIVTLQDDDGNEFDFEIIGQLEFQDKDYVALIPYDEEDADDEETPFIIMKTVYDGDEEFLDMVEDQVELNAVIALFEEQLSDDFEMGK